MAAGHRPNLKVRAYRFFCGLAGTIAFLFNLTSNYGVADVVAVFFAAGVAASPRYIKGLLLMIFFSRDVRRRFTTVVAGQLPPPSGLGFRTVTISTSTQPWLTVGNARMRAWSPHQLGRHASRRSFLISAIGEQNIGRDGVFCCECYGVAVELTFFSGLTWLPDYSHPPAGF